MAVYKIDVRVDVENSLENFKKDLADLVKRADTAPHKIKVQLDRESFEKEITDLKKSVSSISSTNLGTAIKTAPIKKEATEVVSIFDKLESRINAIGGSQVELTRMRNALDLIKPILEEDGRLANAFYAATNQVYSGHFFEQLAYSVKAYSDQIFDATQLTQQFDNIIMAQTSAAIPLPVSIDDTQIKQLRALQAILKKASLEVEDFTKTKNNTSWGMSAARLLSVIEQNASAAQLKVLGLKRSLNSVDDVKGLLIGLATGTQGVSYNDGFGLDSFKTSTVQIREAINSHKEFAQRIEQDNAGLIELRNSLINTFGDLPVDPESGALLVTLEQLRKVSSEAPAALQYIDEIEKRINMTLYESRGATDTPISQIKVKAEEASNSEERLNTVTQELTETFNSGVIGEQFVSLLPEIRQQIDSIVKSISALNTELRNTPSNGRWVGSAGGSRRGGNSSTLSVAQEEEIAYKEWNKMQREQQRIHDQTIVSWNKLGDAADREEQKVERATQREIDAHYKAEQAAEESAFRELNARRTAEEQKRSEIARSFAAFEAAQRKEEEDVLASTQREIAIHAQAERAREAKIAEENEKLFQSHVNASRRRRELEEQSAHQENEAYQSGLRKAEQKVEKEIELERTKYQEELEALEEYERAREAKIEKENEKLFQSHVNASVTSRWQAEGLTASNIKSLFGKALNNKELFSDFEAIQEKYRELIQLQEQWKANGSNATAPEVESITKLRMKLKQLIEDRLEAASSEKQYAANEDKRQAQLKRGYALLKQIQHAEESWTKAKNGKSAGEYANLQSYDQRLTQILQAGQVAGADAKELTTKINQLNAEFARSSVVIHANGEATKSWGEQIGSLAKKFGTWFNITRVIMSVIRAIRNMISSSIEIGSALTQLRIVTNANNREMDEFANTAIQLSQKLGKSVTELIKPIETFSRLGYSLRDASALSEYATVLSNVASVDIDEATTGLTSIVKGYNLDVDDAEHVADVLVEVGQKYAVSASEMMEAYEKSGAALHATNTSLEKSAGLIAAANASVQDSSVVGTALKTVSARVRGSDLCASIHSNMYAQVQQAA